MAKKREGAGWSLIPAGTPPTSGPQRSLPIAEQFLRISLDRRKKGKVVTVVAGFSLTPAALKSLARDLRNRCGTGGTTTADTIELQGDQQQRAREWLESRGWRAK